MQDEKREAAVTPKVFGHADDLDSRSSESQQLAQILLGEDAERILIGENRRGQTAAETIDKQTIQLSGVRLVSSKHLTLYTDLPSDPDVDQLPQVFDLAVPQWCEYFGLSVDSVSSWHMTGYLMHSRDRFRQVGLLPPKLPSFLHGFQRANELWCLDQPSSYFRRHLLLHEGTHGFMHRFLGGVGAAWYAEGMAELLSTHRWQDGQLQLKYFPAHKEEVPMWGRIRIIQDQFQQSRALMIGQVMRYGADAYLKVEPYAWCWAAAAFLDGHPDFRDRFRQLKHDVALPPAVFYSKFEQSMEGELRQLDEQWQIFVAGMEYGYDLERTAVLYKSGKSVPADGATISVRADRGWQSSGFRLEAGQPYEITAKGRYQVAKTSQPWFSEPGGVTIRYFGGRPLGMLLGKVRLDQPAPGMALLTQPAPIGRGRVVTPENSGTLYLRINDSPAELSDNQGELKVTIRPQRP
jgi:hypothetical protein